jgi:Flp pilus assembly protein TadG
MPFPVLGSNSAVAGFEIDNSLRFNDGDLPLLTRTHSDTNHRTFTFSCWVKRSALGTGNQRLFNTDDEASDDHRIRFTSADILHISDNQGGTSYELDTNRVFRDVSAFYHIVVAWDTTQGTAANRIKLYVNGVQETSFSTAIYPPQNYDTLVNQNASHEVGGSLYDAGSGPRQPFDGYMSEVYFIDGQQLAPTEFGETNDNGVWIPKRYEGTYGTNGFKLEFKNSGALGTDTSGNGNNFTPTNLTATDQTTDTPTNNFCTGNPLANSSYTTLSEGNCKMTGNTSTDNGNTETTFAVSNGKWYWEWKATTTAAPYYPLTGVLKPETVGRLLNGATNAMVGVVTDSVSYEQDGDRRISNVTTSGHFNSFTSGDIIGIALDMDNGAVYFSKNGTWENSSDPESGASKTNAAHTWTTDGRYYMAASANYNNSVSEWNFGNAPFSISSGNSDANGYGNFEYAVPSGYYSLCTKNLAEYG